MGAMFSTLRSVAGMIIIYGGLSHPANAEDGIFCKGTLTFAARTDASGDLSFGVAGTDSRQHIFSEQGKAKLHGHGWRYQVLSKDNPDQRCTIDIIPAGQGYRLYTHEGAACESSGGYRANELISNATFLGSNRVRGITHELDPGSQILNVDCSRKGKKR